MIMQQAAKKIGEGWLYNDEAIILTSIGVLERSLEEEISSKDKYKIDGLAWCALNLGNSGDSRSTKVLTDIVASELPKKVRNHAAHALKVLGVGG